MNLPFTQFDAGTVSIVAVVACAVVCCIVVGRKNPYKSAKNHYFIYITLAAMVLIVYLLAGLEHFSEKDTWLNFADNLLSGTFFGILCLFAYGIEKRIKNRFEDREKLNANYKQLADMYKLDDLVKIGDAESGECEYYPVIRMGTGKIPLCHDEPKNIIINDSQDIYELPFLLQSNYSNIFEVHDTSITYNNVNIRMNGMTLDNGKLTLETQRTTYYNSLVTNRAADFEFCDGVSVRKIFEPGPRMSSLELSQLSNHIGFNGFIESSDGYVVFVYRASDMSIGKNTFGDSIAASMKAKYALNEEGEFTYFGLRRSVVSEIKDELKIEEADIQLDSLCIFAIYRDCVECGKPQFLIYAKSRLDAATITNHFIEGIKSKRQVDGKKNGASKKEKLEAKALTDGRKLIWVSSEDLKEGIEFSRQGIKESPLANEGFVIFKHGMKQKSSLNFMKMVPSASAAVKLFQEEILSDRSVH